MIVRKELLMECHPLVEQLRFTRSEFVRCLEGVSSADALHRLGPMNCISWIVGHLANQEHFMWVMVAQGKFLAPGLHNLVGTGQPASAPALGEMWAIWQTVTDAADEFLGALDTQMLQTHLEWEGEPMQESIGTWLLRNVYHYWYHTGEAHAIRQMLGHENLPQFVGEMSRAIYRPEWVFHGGPKAP